ncbi:MAG: hypothetical protein MJ172_09500 [Clostridia bacterium]|nr:hypothetical protein [Clostridia bacterium]
MTSNTMLLLKTLLKSTSDINVLKFSKDKAKRRYATNSLIGQGVLSIVILIYATLLSVSLAKSNQATIIPGLCAFILIVMPFMFTLFKANGYLFGFKEYDMIMSMPFSVKSIVSAKFLYMYIKSMPMYVFVSLSMLIGYAVGGCLNVGSFIQWIIMTLLIPVIPMVIATALGALVVKIGAGFKYKNIVQAVLIAILILPVFFGRFFVENTMRNDELDAVMNSLADNVNSTYAYIPVAKWFSEAVNDGVLLSFLLVVSFSILIYVLFIIILSKFYRRMNSQLSASAKNTKYELTSQKQKSMVKSIAFKEFKRMTGSSTYLLNAGLGQVMTFIMSIALLFVKPEVVISTMLQGAPIEASMVFPAIPILFYFFLGMVPTTCCSPSLEGKNYWIIQTLPIDPMDDNKGKILYNLCISVPFGIFATVAASICFKPSIIDAISSVIAIISLCVFATIFGLRSGLKHRRLDWENEIEVIKQGMAVSMYIIPHMISGMIMMPLVVIISKYLHSVAATMLILSLIAWVLTALSWKGVKKYTPSH